MEEKSRFTYELQSCILLISQMSKINFKIRCTTECYWHVRVLKKHINVKIKNGMFDGKISYCTKKVESRLSQTACDPKLSYFSQMIALEYTDTKSNTDTVCQKVPLAGVFM